MNYNLIQYYKKIILDIFLIGKRKSEILVNSYLIKNLKNTATL